MNKSYCEPGKHQYGQWSQENEKGIRICTKCNYKEILPINDTIKEEIKKQKEALIFYKAFQKVQKNDNDIIEYIKIMLEDCINYLDKEQKEQLLKQISSTPLDLENQKLINSMQQTYFNNQNDYLDTLDIFIENNSVEQKGYTR